MPSAPTISETAAVYFSRLTYGEIPPAAIAKIKLLFLDTLGRAIAGSQTGWGRSAIALAAGIGGDGAATVLGSATRTNAVAAALANGCLAHALDFDDTYFAAIVHPSCCVVPATLAVAEARNCSGKDAILGAFVGYELLLRVARGGRNCFFTRNYHTTGLLGALGASMASARILGLGAEASADALGIAAGLGSGILQPMREGQHVKALQAGYAAHGGVMASMLAAAGTQGPRQAFEGELGLYRTYLEEGSFDPALILDRLGQDCYTPDIAIKMYPGAHRHHFFVESVLHVVQRHGLVPEEISDICCVSAPNDVYYNFTPAGRRPPNAHLARFSVPFLIACALAKGRVTLASFSDAAIGDEALLLIAAKVSHVTREGAESPENRGHVIVTLQDGRSFENVQRSIRGLPDTPATEQDIRRKFEDNAAPVIGASQAAALAEAIVALEQQEAMCDLLSGVRWP